MVSSRQGHYGYFTLKAGYFYIFFAVFISISIPNTAQPIFLSMHYPVTQKATGKRNDGYTKSENLKASSNYVCPQKPLLQHGGSEELVEGKMYAVGWSRAGHFAYATVNYQDAAGFTEIRLVVQDMKTDSIVDELTSESFSKIEKFWEEKHLEINNLLEKYDMEIHRPFVLKNTPVIIDDDTITISIQHVHSDTQAHVMGAVIKNPTMINIFAESRSGVKRIFGGKYIHRRTMVLAGYLKSPFEPRGCIIVKYNIPGQHGTRPHYLYYQCIGVHFMSGFRERK